MNRHYRNLILIAILLVVVIWVDWPGNPGIHIAGFDRNLDTQLGLDLRGGLRVILEADTNKEVTTQSLTDTKTILERRSNALGVSEVTFQISGQNRIVAEFPGLTNTNDVVKALNQVGKLAFVPAGTANLAEGTKIKIDYTKTYNEVNGITTAATPPAGATAVPTAAPTAAAGATATAVPETVYYPLLTGSDLDASAIGVSRDSLGGYSITFSMLDSGRQIFGDFTAKHVGEVLAITLDDVVISAPSIKSAIPDGKGIIEGGNFTQDSANALAINLRYGSLPVPIKVVQTQAVGASLGQDSITKSIVAGVIGLSMVAVLMLVSYRLSGFLALLALLVYGLLNFALYRIIPVTLTLPGIAGFVLSIGMAVDANILIFERLKEELRAGRALEQAIDLAWRRAWPSIRDSNSSTIITCVILIWFGATFGATIVVGFALNLLIGVLTSLFTAIIVTRTFLHVTMDNLKITEHPRWFGV